jgi:two-component system CheB/CheR fusion protein
LVSNQSKRGTAKGAKSAGPSEEPEGDPATLEVAADLSAERLLSAPLRDEHVQRLEGELRLTRERLQATIEELESTNEELKTSKEELQSVNEELQTLNGELAHRVQDLGRANCDLKNLLESTKIATIFLDNDLRIKNFTPAVADIFHVIESDLGRPITHIEGHLSYADLEEDVRKVLRTLHTIERELDHPKTGGRFLVRVLPYRSIDNFIAGVVLTFLDVSAAAKAEKALKESEERYRAFVHATSNSLFRLSGDRSRLTEMWGSLLRQHSAGVEPSAGWLTEYIHPDDRKDMAETMARAFETGSPYELEHRGRRADGGWGWVVSRAVPVRNEAGEIIEWLGTATDITERKRAEEAQQVLISELQHRTRNLLAIVSSLSRQTLRTSKTLADYERAFGDRLLALSRVQDLLSQGDGFTVTLGELVKGELEAHGAGVDGRRVLVEGPEVPLSSKEVQVLTLAVHELATNAIKYGALRSTDANLSIRWRHLHQDGQHYILINWSEEGVVYPGAPDGVKRGFGRELIERALPYDLGAETSFELAEDGVRCELKLPVRPPSEFRSPTRDRPNGGSRPGGS